MCQKNLPNYRISSNLILICGMHVAEDPVLTADDAGTQKIMQQWPNG